MRFRRVALVVVLLTIMIGGCENDNPAPPPSTPGGGWTLQTVYEDLTDNSLPVAVPDVTVYGQWEADEPGATGNDNPFSVTTGTQGLYYLAGVRAPAKWELTWQAGGPTVCAGLMTTATVAQGSLEDLLCLVTTITIGDVDAFSPNPVNTSSLPATVTITGSGFTATYGMPLAQYYDSAGTLVAQESATEVGSGGTSITGPTPSNLASLESGLYTVVVSNAVAGGNWEVAGAASVNLETPIPYSPPQPPPCKPCPLVQGTADTLLPGFSRGYVSP